MSEKPPGKSGAMPWSLVIIAIPLLYIGTYPPIACLAIVHQMQLMKPYSGDVPHWLESYGAPYDWAQRTAPKARLEAYFYWWADRIVVPAMAPSGE